MRDLREYRQRRDPGRTPEPFGEESAARALPPGAARGFVVQQHAAQRMHWDLRLEIGAVLVSWAVPRGPSLDPAERRLAVQTEDHPLEYADFEGVIPAGNYGAGAMIVWDRGSYRTADGSAPEAGLAAGKLDLLLEGHKLRGRFALVRTRGAARAKTGAEASRDWLLIRKGERPAEAGELVETQPASVLSGLTVEERAAGATRDAEVEARLRAWRAPRRAFDLAALRPMLATPGDEPFSRAGWLFELKYDGVRVLVAKRAGEVRVAARSGADRTATYPEIAAAAAQLPLGEFVLDGEIVALDERGGSSFERLQSRFTQTDPAAIARARAEIPVVLQVFDCLFAGGRDLRGLPLARRKQILSLFAPRLGVVRFADHVEGDGLALFEAAERHGLEGVVAKRAESVYETGRRSPRWIKLRVPRCTRLAIVALLPGRGSRGRLGSLMLAWHRETKTGRALVYAGNAGSGLSERAIDALLPRLEALRVAKPAFEGVPAPLPRGASFVRPELVCRVRYTEVTSAGLLRHPVYEGLAEDARPEECEAPREHPQDLSPPAAAAPEPADGPSQHAPPLALTRLDKVFWPAEGYTKGDLLAYYEAVWPWLEPYLRDRPVVLTRYPDGIEGKHFYQKNAPDFTPEWARRERIDGTDYFLCNDLRTLLHVVNSGAIPLHVWSARLGSLERPDWLILDLDPKGAPFAQVVQVARHLHGLLEGLGAPHFVKTSGQDGLHVLVPLGARLGHEEAKALGEVLARVVCAERGEIATVARPLAARGGKVYVDYLQNGRGKLIAAPLSVRPRPGAPVSMPLAWSQVTARLDPVRFHIRSAPRRLAKGGDPLRGLLGEPADVEALLGALGERLGAV
jgi:bifunctional non-homologous end joining protein LigD